jgi:hypothetical protein
MKNTRESLKWIASILNQNDITYRLGGGMAMKLYGSERPVNDIDISVSGKDFRKIIPLTKDYITSEPRHYKNEKWDCNTLSLSHNGQEIDLTDVDTLRMSSKDKNQWIKNKDIYEKYSDVKIDIDGIEINLMNPKTLLEYKKELDGKHQEEDIIFLEKIIDRY